MNSTEGVGWTLLHMASRHVHFDIVHLLIDHGAEVNTKMGHLTALHLASHNDYFKALLERGAHVHERAEAGRTPLPMTVMCGHWDIMHAIIEGVSRARHSGLLRRMGSLYRVGRYKLRPQKQGPIGGMGQRSKAILKAADSGLCSGADLPASFYSSFSMDPLSHSYYKRHPEDTVASPSHPCQYE